MELDVKPKVTTTAHEISTIDTLPVVEIRPFTRQVWRREKSFPEFYNKPPETNQNTQERYYPGENLPNIVEVLSDITQSSNKLNEDDQKRTRSKIHPKMPSINVATSCKTSGIIASFITKDERTKTTLFMSKQDENPKSFSCRKQALNSATIRRHQQMKLDGDPMNLPEEIQNRFVYLNPMRDYRERALKHIKYRQSHHNSAPSDDRIKDMISLPGKELGISGIPRKRSASKLRLRPLSASKRDYSKLVLSRENSKNSQKQTFEFPDCKPIIIEKQLEHERTFHLQRCRRKMDIGYTSLELLQHLHNENILNRPMTQGEMAIQKGKTQNKTKSKQEKIPKNLAPVFETKRRRGKVLSIRRLGPDPVLSSKGRPTRRKSLKGTQKTDNEDSKENKCSDGSDVSMASENGEKPMSGSEADSMISESSQEKKRHNIPNFPSDHEGTPALNTPAKESHTQSPVIEIVAQVNSDSTTALLKNASAVNDVQSVVSNKSQAVDNSLLQSHNEIVQDLRLCQKGIERRPKACAYDEENCHKHKPENEKNFDKQNLDLSLTENGLRSSNSVHKNIAKSSSNQNRQFGENVDNSDKCQSNELTDNQESRNTGNKHILTDSGEPDKHSSDNFDKNKSSEIFDKNNSSVSSGFDNGSSISYIRGDNLDNNLGCYKKHVDNILEDKQTQVDNVGQEENVDDGIAHKHKEDVTDGETVEPEEDDPLLPSTTFLTTNI